MPNHCEAGGSAQAPKIRVLIVDDHPLVLEGLQSCLETFPHIEVVGAAGDARSACAHAANLTLDVVLMDINMPGLNGLQAIEMIAALRPETRILMLSMHDNREYVSAALSHGAKGYVLKDAPTADIVAGIDAVAAGGAYFSAGVAECLGGGGPACPTLTSREQSVLLRLADGFSNKEVAQALNISVRTVETHRKNIKRKIGVSSAAGLTRYAIEQGLLKLRRDAGAEGF